MPPFHGERMRLYGEMMCEIADRSIDAWPVDRSFPVHARLQDITLEVMLRVVFGVTDESRLVRLVKAVVEALDLWDVGNPLRPLKAGWRFGCVRREIDKLLLDEVRSRRAEEPEERTDIMSMLVSARDEDGSAMSDEEVRDEMFTMLVAGQALWAIGVETIRDVGAKDRCEVEKALCDIPGVGRATIHMLLMYCGNDEYVKADVHICGFVADALGVEKVRPELAEALVASAARKLDMKPVELDVAIWTWRASGTG